MTRPHIIKWLRVGTSVVCLAVSAGLGWLWWRSHTWCDDMSRLRSNNVYTGLTSNHGTVVFVHRTMTESEVLQSLWLQDLRGHNAWKRSQMKAYPTNGLRSGYRNRSVLVPHWFPILTLAVLAAIPWLPWLRWRFSLKTLLLTTAIVSAVLGTAVWLARG
jgi:hypothetical protein